MAVWARAGRVEEVEGAVFGVEVAKGSTEEEDAVGQELKIEGGKGQVDKFACICRAASGTKLASDLASSFAWSLDTRWLFWGGLSTSANGNGVEEGEGEDGVIEGEASKLVLNFASSNASASP